MIKKMVGKVVGFMVLAAALLVMPAISQAQYKETSPCNNSVSDAVNGANPLRIRFQLHANYATTSGKTTVTDEFAPAAVDVLNAIAVAAGRTARYQFSPFDASEDDRNLTFYIEEYENGDGTYNTYLSVGGWDTGHLFNIHDSNAATPGDGFVNIMKRAEDMLAKGWVCAD